MYTLNTFENLHGRIIINTWNKQNRKSISSISTIPNFILILQLFISTKFSHVEEISSSTWLPNANDNY
jgi:hypothetical protein